MFNKDVIPYAFFDEINQECRAEAEHEWKAYYMGEPSDLLEFPRLHCCPHCKGVGTIDVPSVLTLFSECEKCGAEIDVWKEEDLAREQFLKAHGLYDKWKKKYSM